MKRIVQNLADLKSKVSYMSSTITKWPVLLEIIENFSERSEKQNRTWHMHFAEAEKFFGWPPGYGKRFAKYNYGLPILATRRNKKGEITEDGKYWSDTLERIDTWPYEVRIEFMEKMPVTSEFTKGEGALFITSYMREWETQGCPLTDPKTIDPECYAELDKEMRSRGVA